MSQTALFDVHSWPAAESEASAFRNRAPLAANTDPASSHIAGCTVTTNGVRINHKRALLNSMGGGEWKTSAELAADGGFDRVATARRLPDLERDGFVPRLRDSTGVEVLRICRVTGGPYIVWRAIDRDALSKVDKSRPRAEAAPVPPPAPCPCKGAGRIRMPGTELKVYVFCDEARGRVCLHAQGRRRIHPDPNREHPDDAQNRSPEVRL